MRRHGLEPAGWVVHGGDTENDGRRAAWELLRHPEPPTAIAAFNDPCALGVIDACAEAGVRVPGQVAVTGYDDTPLARLHAIDLTSVRQEATELARMAVEAAVQRLDEGRRRGRDTVLIPRLVIRRSSGEVLRPV